MLIGISGLAGSGKDQTADFLREDWGAQKVSLADPLKRIARDVYDFTDQQLWGPSEMRNAPDTRYPRPHTWGSGGDTCACCGVRFGRAGHENMCFLTPRYALQLLGTEWGRQCFPDTWAALCVRTAQQLLRDPCVRYDQKQGLRRFEDDRFLDPPPKAVTVPDVRFRNEMRVIREAGGYLVRVKRPGAGLGGSAGLHPSEVEQASIPDQDFDLVINNNGTLDELRDRAKKYVLALSMGRAK